MSVPSEADFVRLDSAVNHLGETVERLERSVERMDQQAEERERIVNKLLRGMDRVSGKVEQAADFGARLHELELYRARDETRNALLKGAPYMVAAVLSAVLSAIAVFKAMGG